MRSVSRASAGLRLSAFGRAAPAPGRGAQSIGAVAVAPPSPSPTRQATRTTPARAHLHAISSEVRSLRPANWLTFSVTNFSSHGRGRNSSQFRMKNWCLGGPAQKNRSPTCGRRKIRLFLSAACVEVLIRGNGAVRPDATLPTPLPSSHGVSNRAVLSCVRRSEYTL